MPSIQTLGINERRLAAWLRDTAPAREQMPQGDEAWLALADQAADAGLSGLVLDHADHNGAPLPPICRDRLGAASMTVAVRHLNMMRELENLLRAFNAAGVPVMLLKGAALNLTVYERADQRPMSDLDLLVRPEHVHEALAVLRSYGCEPGYDLIRDDFFPKYHYEVEFFTGGVRPIRLDLHVRPFRPLRLALIMPDEALWTDAHAIQIGKAEAFIPRPELMFLHLAAHAGYHGCCRLLWLYDLKRLVRHYGSGLDWSLIARCALRWRLSCAVVEAVRQTEALLGPVLPEAARKALCSQPTNWRDRWTLRQAPRDAAAPFAHVACHLLCTPGVRLRMGYLMAQLFPGPKHLAGVYPFRHSGWIWCANVVRMSRALGKLPALPVRSIVAICRCVGRRFLRALAHGRAAMPRPAHAR